MLWDLPSRKLLLRAGPLTLWRDTRFNGGLGEGEIWSLKKLPTFIIGSIINNGQLPCAPTPTARRMDSVSPRQRTGYPRVMKLESLHLGMRLRHPQYGLGTVKSINPTAAEIEFTDGTHTVAPEPAGVEPAEPQAGLSGLSMPLKELIQESAEATVRALGLERPETVDAQLGARWHKGKLVMHPADLSLQTKEVSLETFFHKIVMVRNNLRVLEQKINAHAQLSDAEKVEMQQYITRSYGSLTTFNILFKEKDDQF